MMSIRKLQGTATVLGLCLAGALLAGCETLMPANNQMQQDVLEIKTRLNESLDRQASTERSLSSQINALSENLDKNSNLSSSNFEELNKRVNDQAEEMNKLRGEVETLNSSIASRGQAPPYGSNINQSGDAATSNSQVDDTNPMAPGNSSSATDTIAQATEFYNNGQYAQAKEAFTTALSQNPTGDLKVDAEFGLGESCYKLKDLDGAKTSYKQAIAADRKNPKAWVALERVADIDLTQGNRDEAVKFYDYIAKNKPNYPDIDSVKRKLDAARSGKGVDLN